MAYLGNTVTTQGFIPAIDYFSGNASTTAFTLSRPVASVAQVQVVVSNVPQIPGDAFTVSGNTITFTSAPPSGTNNIYVYYTSPITQVIQPSQGTVGAVQLDTGSGGAGTGSMILPSGTTAQRPASTSPGQMRYNSTTGATEVYQNSLWQPLALVYSVDYLVVAGGGGGGGSSSTGAGNGGGGAGGYLSLSSVVIAANAYSITIGAGGAGGANDTYRPGVVGSNSSALSSTSIGGGGGGTGSINGLAGGSGGGSGYNTSGGAGTSGQGNNGGTNTSTSSPFACSGGGGAGAAGGNGGGSTAGVGGAGLNWQSLGTYYAGGGGSADINGNNVSAGGVGGGGAGGSRTGVSGTANTGGGGGGGGGGAGGSGGSGVVIIRYLGTQRGTGGTVTSSGGYTYHTFTTSGTFTA